MNRIISSRIDIIRNGVKYGSFSYSKAPKITANSSGEICMACKATVDENSEMDVLTDLIRPVAIVNGSEYAMGDYVIGTKTDRFSDGKKSWDIEAYDKSLLCKQSKTSTILHYDAGLPYIDAIKSLLTESGITVVISTPNADTLATDREDWEIGTSRLEIINALLDEINFYPLYFDLNGYARLTQKTTPGAENINITYRADEASILYPDCASELDIFDAPNVFLVLLSNSEQDAMIATSTNDSPASALSTIRRGREIVSITKVDNIASEAALQEYADNLRNASLLSTETIEFYTGLNPLHSVHDIIALHHPMQEGIYLETGWSVTLKAGEQMKHTARRSILI